ncbi:nuclease-related domain-containing protein [Alkalicoccobacillus plakortidis]|uniref:NERD domain-containing protein n=1 Tax=Alkalicoccobacillus plakortidis TaxID=444060 RepID=A0ABT0XL94_9BACI|nr:nuclease-related domain-containing protein [Alkalicoccobacillus plakortidis]MCM2676682.1 NERD domain-containing protein [Alkalicoccobacillus plakortidis]
MIVKKRYAPIQLLGLEALIRRSSSVTDVMNTDLHKWQIGYRGECSIHYYLNQLDGFMILHDLRLPAEPSGFFQIDSLLLSKYGIIILEVKNFHGVIQFNEQSHQVLRILNDKEERIPNPLIQASRQQAQLDSFLIRNGLPSLPVSAYVVYSSPLTIFRTSHAKVIHAEAIPVQLESYKQKAKREYLTRTQMEHISSLLMGANKTFVPDLLKKYGLSSKNIQNGVHCTHCNKLTMIRPSRIRKWTCQNCYFSSQNAHIPTLQDYAVLFQA